MDELFLLGILLYIIVITPSGNPPSKNPPLWGCEFDLLDLQNIRVCEFRLKFISYFKKKLQWLHIHSLLRKKKEKEITYSPIGRDMLPKKMNNNCSHYLGPFFLFPVCQITNPRYIGLTHLFDFHLLITKHQQRFAVNTQQYCSLEFFSSFFFLSF